MTWLQRDALGPVGPLVFNPYAIISNPYAPHRSKRVLIISGLQGEAGLSARARQEEKSPPLLDRGISIRTDPASPSLSPRGPQASSARHAPKPLHSRTPVSSNPVRKNDDWVKQGQDQGPNKLEAFMKGTPPKK